MQNLLLSLLLILIAGNAQAGKLYRWEDARGHVTYQDRPPPPLVKEFEVSDVESSVGAEEKADQPKQVVLYAVDNCLSCEEIRAYLQSRKISVIFKDPEKEASVAVEMAERFGRVEVPIVLIGDKELKGVNVSWLASELDSAGFASAPGN